MIGPQSKPKLRACSFAITHAHDLTVAYGQSEVIHRISSRAKHKETLAIIGRNGMGKSTLFRSLIGVMTACAGRVEVGVNDVSGKPTLVISVSRRGWRTCQGA